MIRLCSILFLIPVWMLTATCTTAYGQAPCKKSTEELLPPKDSTYKVPCEDMVVLDLETYSRYRYFEEQYKRLDSMVQGYSRKLDSLSSHQTEQRKLLKQKIKAKKKTAKAYREHARQLREVLERCKENSEGFAEAYRSSEEKRQALQEKVDNVKTQRNVLYGFSGGLGLTLLLMLL